MDANGIREDPLHEQDLENSTRRMSFKSSKSADHCNTKARSNSYPPNEDYQDLHYNDIGGDDEEDYQEDDDEELEQNFPMELIYNRATRRIIASEYELDKYKDFRFLSEQLYNIASSETLSYPTLIKLLNNKPRDMDKPVYFERAQDVSGF